MSIYLLLPIIEINQWREDPRNYIQQTMMVFILVHLGKTSAKKLHKAEIYIEMREIQMNFILSFLRMKNTIEVELASRKASITQGANPYEEVINHLINIHNRDKEIGKYKKKEGDIDQDKEIDNHKYIDKKMLGMKEQIIDKENGKEKDFLKEKDSIHHLIMSKKTLIEVLVYLINLHLK